MRKYLILWAFMLGSLISAIASNDSLVSRIVIFRENNLSGSLNAYKIYANDSMIAVLKNNTFVSWACKAGKYKLMINKDKNSEIDVNVEKGRTYYIRLGLQTGFWSNNAELMPMDSAFAVKKLSMGNMKLTANTSAEDKYLANRIGVNMGFGFGFENFKMFSTNTTDTARISFGGGYMVGIKYGHELNKHFDIDIDVNYQFSVLMPYLSNATTTYRRGYISVTPALMIPIDAASNRKFRIGVGYDLYYDNHLIINGSKVPNCFDAVWKYKTASGFHITATYNMTLLSNWNLDYGLKYYYVYYSFDFGHFENPLLNMAKPNGSGLDVVLGFSYKF